MNTAQTKNGYINIILILIIIVFSVLLGGSFFAPSEPKVTPIVSASSCCETGDGESCRTTDPKIEFNNKTYGLIKKDIALTEGNNHLVYVGDTNSGQKIFISNTQGPPTPRHEECREGEEGDLLASGPKGCTVIPDDSLIYVCTAGCENQSIPELGQGRFDTYFEEGLQIPYVIKNCEKRLSITPGAITPEGILYPSPAPSAEQNLQLRYFKIVKGTANWLSPWCKPAIYLYPEKETEVNVKVGAVGGLITTLPDYPPDGWDVTAYPDGKLNYMGVDMDYLYYESRVPVGVVEKPKEGYLVEYGRLDSLLSGILPELGLHQKESRQFRDYWTNVLPKSPYYFIGIIPKTEISKMSQLNIIPKPESLVRVTLYFEALDSYVNVNPPKLETVGRQGFTVVEWGGIFKKDKDHNFSCLM